MGKKFDIEDPTEGIGAVTQFFTNQTENKEKPSSQIKKTNSQNETKSKRLNLLVKPSLHKDIEKIAAMKRTSTNNIINILLERYAEENQDLIDKYNEIFE